MLKKEVDLEPVKAQSHSNNIGTGEQGLASDTRERLRNIETCRKTDHKDSATQPTDSNRPPISPADGEDYFDAGDGVLVLHDPRFNANLTSVCHRDHINVIPRPGLMLIFSAYVWHSVTPHRGEFHRLSFSMNFTLRWPPGSAEQHSLK